MAVQTLGKDMVWRDYVQGAWRMRRLARGHTIHLLVIPEVKELIHRELARAQVGDDYFYTAALCFIYGPCQRLT